ncbi:NAC domain containing protein 19 [Euphorbia peplus]|nr:NAC domain containing protein 19 [Euphorbia peplus]
MSIPFIGFKFVPTDEELVGNFLFKQLTGTLCSYGSTLVPRHDLYSQEEPWQVYQQFDPNPSYGHNECLYFFTQLKKKPRDSRAVRKVGDGTWHGEDAGKKMVVEVELDGDQKVPLKAMKKRFSYRNKNSNHNGGWIMHEFSILEFDGDTDTVLCQLKKNESGAAANVKRLGKKRKLETEKLKNDYDDQCLSHGESNEFGEVVTVDFTEQTMDVAMAEEGFIENTKSNFGAGFEVVNSEVNRNSDLGVETMGFVNELNNGSSVYSGSVVIGDELEQDFNNNGESNKFREEDIVHLIEQTMGTVDEEGVNEKTNLEFENDSYIVGEIMECGDELNLGVNKNSDVTVLRDESNSELNTTFGSIGESMVIGDELEWDFNSNGDTNSHKGSGDLREEDLDDFIKSLLNPEYLVTSDSDTQQDLLFPQSIFAETSHIV